MTKISVALYYWVLVAATLLFARIAGLADNDMAIIKILIVVTILYVGVVMISYSKGKAKASAEKGKPAQNAASVKNRKKKK